MRTADDMKKSKEINRFTYEQIAKASGIPLATVQKVLTGQTKDPRNATMQALSSGMLLLEEAAAVPLIAAEEVVPFQVRKKKASDVEGNLARKQELPVFFEDWDPGYHPTVRHTIEEAEAIPEDIRVELIDGVFYNMASPLRVHQALIMYLTHSFLQFILENGGSCEVYNGPAGVQLDRDQYTLVEPDIFVLCEPEKYDERLVQGAPDLVVEVLSPTGIRKDTMLKLHKYMAAGVKEYWIVDPKQRTLIVYQLSGESMKVYSFDDTIPVGIWDGRCRVDMKAISKLVYRE